MENEFDIGSDENELQNGSFKSQPGSFQNHQI